MPSPTPESRPFALFAVRLAALWVLAGACFKLFLGSPATLPPLLHDLPLELSLTYKLAIGTELLFVVLALGLPRIGWIAMVALYLVFEVILAILLAQGAESCGCFGSSVTLSPAQMMAIDTSILALLVLSRPWKGTGRGLNPALVGAVGAVVLALPFLYDRELQHAPVATNGIEAPAPAPPKPKNAWAILDIENWVGESIYDTALAGLIEPDVGTLPIDGIWVLWRADCDHCAEHLEELYENPPDVPFLTLVQLEQKHDTEENRVVHFLPNGPNVVEASLPADVEYVMETPGEMVLEGSMIVAATEGVEHGDGTH